MKSTTLPSLSLTDFEISEERGFLPTQDPKAELPQCRSLQHLVEQLPKLLAVRQLRQFAKELIIPVPHQDDQWDIQTYRAAGRMLSFVAHGYIWEDPEHPAILLPANLAVPWVQVSKKLGRPPVLSYASYALDNWRRLDNHQPIELGNIVLLQNFLGGLDEEWFILVHVEIEAKAIPAIQSLQPAIEAANSKDFTSLTEFLVTIKQ